MIYRFILLISGLLFLILGWLIWKKEKISLIHDYHYVNVSEKDKKNYTKMMGKATCLMGIGILLTGIIDWITSSSYAWFAFGIGFGGGLVIMLITKKKYNGGLF